MYFKHFYEATSRKLVICDIQPAYQKVISAHFDMRDFVKFAMQYSEVVVLYNGPELGYEDAGGIARWYNQYGVPGSVLRSWKWYEKNYNWFRDLMDKGCWHRKYLIKLIRYMIKMKKWDWRDLSEEEFEYLAIPDMTIDLVHGYGFNIPDLAFRIRRLDGADICGGGFNECLAEVTLLADALNVRLNIIHEYTYG